ncbi:hypothetical protein BH11BAC2_BH11BAC2_20140 [soil metagenome]
MVSHLFRRFLSFVIALAGIAICGFLLTRISPREAVRQQLGANISSSQIKEDFYIKRYEQLYRKLRYDRQVFYWSWSGLAVPDSFYRLPDKYKSEQLIELSAISGCPEKSIVFYQLLAQLQLVALTDPDPKVNDLAAFLPRASSVEQLRILLNNPAWKNSASAFRVAEVNKELLDLLSHSKPWKNWIPEIHFTFDNQFHYWLFGDGNWLTGEGALYSRGALRGDLGKSYRTQSFVKDEIKNPFLLTLKISLWSILICFLISIPIAISLIRYKHTQLVKIIQPSMIFIYAIPLFWMGTLLLMTFANPDFLKWFPASGIAPQGGFPADSSWWNRFLISLPYFVLPVICYIYGAIIFLSRILQASLLQELEMDYIQTARAKGLHENKVLYKHALRNSILPLLTITIGALPVMVSGSLLIENIFSLPGMGTGLVHSVQLEDHPMMIGYFILTGAITILAFMMSDFIFTFIDPRIRIQKTASGYE